MVNDILSKLFRRKGMPADQAIEPPYPQDGGAQTHTTPALATTANILPPVGNYSFLDVSDEKNFLLLTGIKEDEFIALVLSSKAGLMGDEQHNNTTLFESYEVVKKLRVLEKELQNKQQMVEQTYTLLDYTTRLQNSRSQWNEKIAGVIPENGHVNGNGHAIDPGIAENRLHRYHIWLQKKSDMNIKNLQDFYFGPALDTNTTDDNKIFPYGNQADIETVYKNREGVKQKMVKELEDDIANYSSTNARNIYIEYNKAYSIFFWNLLLQLSFFILTSFFIWHLISPFSWAYLPVAILLGWLLIFVPPLGFKNLFKLGEVNDKGNSEKQPDNVSNYKEYKAQITQMTPKKRGWLIAFDVFLPVAISATILLINWNSISGYTLPLLTMSGVFVLLLLTRAAVCLILPSMPEKYTEAIEKLYQKRAFDKYRKEHEKKLQAGKFNYNIIEEIKEHEKLFLESEAAFRQRYLAILDTDNEQNRRMFINQMQQYYRDNEENFSAYYKQSQGSPYLQDINDLGTVRRLLARLDYLFNLAIRS